MGRVVRDESESSASTHSSSVSVSAAATKRVDNIGDFSTLIEFAESFARFRFGVFVAFMSTICYRLNLLADSILQTVFFYTGISI